MVDYKVSRSKELELEAAFGTIDPNEPWTPEEFQAFVTKFEKLIRADEREACAKTAESLDDWANDPYETATIREIAALIRARGNSETK